MKTRYTPPQIAQQDPQDGMDVELARQLQRIESEETPEHLLTLARELQNLLRRKM